MPTNDYLPFCPTDTGSNLEDNATYLANAQRVSGNAPGIADLELVNKALRQGTAITSQMAQFIANQTGSDVLDSTPQDLPTLLALITQAFSPAPGIVSPYAGSSAPSGYLLCNGASVLQSAYPGLFAIIGTTYGSVDGTHFNVPDLRGIFIRGVGSQAIGGITYAGTLAAKENDQMQSHLHVETASSASGGGILVQITTGGASPFSTTSLTLPPSVDGANGTPRVGAETYPANMALNYIIKT